MAFPGIYSQVDRNKTEHGRNCHGQEKTRNDVSPPERIATESQVTETAQTDRANHQRQQQKRRNQNGAGEVTLKIHFFEELQSADLRAGLSPPINRKLEQDAKQHHTQKLTNNFSYARTQ